MAGKFLDKRCVVLRFATTTRLAGGYAPVHPLPPRGTSGLARPDTDAKDPLPLTRIFWCSHDCAAA